jgi:hypothetical protein
LLHGPDGFWWNIMFRGRNRRYYDVDMSKNLTWYLCRNTEAPFDDEGAVSFESIKKLYDRRVSYGHR